MRNPFESFLLSMLVDPRINDGTLVQNYDISHNELRNELLMTNELFPYDSETPPNTYQRSYGNLSYNVPVAGDGYSSKKEYMNGQYPSRSFAVPGDLYGHPVNYSAEYSSASLSPFLSDRYIPSFTKKAAINLISKLAMRNSENLFFERVESGSRNDWWTEKYFGKGSDGPFINVDYSDYYNKDVPGGFDLSLPELIIDSSQTSKVIPEHYDYFINKQAAQVLYRSLNFIQNPKRKYLTMMDVLNFTQQKVRLRAVGYRPIFKRFDPIWMAHYYTVGDYEVILQVNYKNREIENLNPERDPFRVSCSCPFWRWQGPEHWARRFLYLYSDPVGTASVPVIRDPMRRHGMCKHVYALFRTIINNYRSTKGYKENRGKGKPIVDLVTSLDTRKVPTITKKPTVKKIPKSDVTKELDKPFNTLTIPEKKKR